MTIFANEGVAEYVSNCRPNGWVLCQKLVDQVSCITAEVCRDDKLATFDSYESVLDRCTFERRLTCHHSVHDAAEAPQVCLESIRLVKNDLWRNIIRRPTQRLSLLCQV